MQNGYDQVVEEVRSVAEEDPEAAYRARLAESEERARRNIEQYRAAATGLLADLRELGYEVGSAQDLIHRGVRYTDAVPVLVKWMRLATLDRVREDIIRALTVPWAKTAVPALLEEFWRLTHEPHLQWVVGNALETLADDNLFNELAKITRDSSLGSSRAMVVLAMGKMRKNREPAADVLLEVIDDQNITFPAIQALSKLKVERTRPVITKLLDHPDADTRKQAKRAIAQLDRAAAKNI